MPDKKAMVWAMGGYLKNHPEELVRVAKNAVGMRFGVPLDALRWLAGQVRGKKAPKEVRLTAVPPGIRASAIVDLAGTAVRAAATVFIERVALSEEELRFELRLSDVDLRLVDDASESPVATLLKSGALDLSKPGNLAAFMPKRPAMLVDAAEDRITLDLRKHPKLATAGAEKVLRAVLPLIILAGIETDTDHLDFVVRPLPSGVGDAVSALRGIL